MTSTPPISPPDEVFLPIFSHFSIPALLSRLALVCQRWERLVGDANLWKDRDARGFLREFKVVIFDREEWETHADIDALGLDFSDIHPLLNYDALKDVGRFFARLKEQDVRVEGDAGLTLMMVPKNLSIDVLMLFASQPKSGNSSAFRHDLEYFKELTEKTVEKSYRVIITNGLLSRKDKEKFVSTRYFTKSEQKILVKEELGMEWPEALEASTMAMTMFIRSTPPVRLLGPYPIDTYTFCKNKFQDWQIIVGGYNVEGLMIDLEEDFSLRNDGSAAALKL